MPRSGLDDVIGIAAKSDGIALHFDGTVSTWAEYSPPAIPSNLKPVIKVAGYGKYVLVLQNDGTVAEWGGSTQIPGNLSNVVDIADSGAGLALRADGTLVNWRTGTSSASDSPNDYRVVPSDIQGHVVSVAAGYKHNMVLLDDGSIRVWGEYDESAQAGRFATAPASLTKPTTDIACGYGVNVVLHDNGTITAFGSNVGGVRNFPPQQNVVSIAAGSSQLGVVYMDGTAAGWGNIAPIPSSITNIAAFEPHFLENVFLTMPQERPFGRLMPENYHSGVDETVLMVCHAVGLGKLTYQWKLNGKELPGQTKRWLRIASIKASQAGSYTCEVSNSHGTYETEASTISVGSGSLAIETEQLSLAMANGYPLLPVRIPIETAGLALEEISATSDAPWITPTVDSSTGELLLTFHPELISNGTTTTVRVTSGLLSDSVTVDVRRSSLKVTRLLADSHRSRIYGVHQNGEERGSLVVFDPSTGQPIGSVTLGRHPTDIAQSKDGRELFAINLTDKSITVVDLDALQVKETIGSLPFGIWSSGVGIAEIEVGPGNVLYYTDGSWGPVMRVYDRASHQVIQAIDIQNRAVTGSESYNGGSGFGDFVLAPDGSALFGWAQYGWSAGSAGSYLARFTVAADGKLTLTETTTSDWPNGLRRDPLDSPIFMNSESSTVFAKELAVDASNIALTKRSFPGTIRSITPGGEIAITDSTMFDVLTGNPLYELPLETRVQAVTPDYSRFVYFDGSAIKTIALEDALGNATPGNKIFPPDGTVVLRPDQLKWRAIPGVFQYRVYFGASESAVQNATPSSSTYLGETGNLFFELTSTLTEGTTYFWRIDAVTPDGAARGPVRSFTVSSLVSSLSKIDTGTLVGHANHRVIVNLTSSSPGQTWHATANQSWVKFASADGTTPGSLEVILNASALEPGVHTAAIDIAVNGSSSLTLPVTLIVNPLRATILKSDPASPLVYGISEDTTADARAYLFEFDTDTESIQRVTEVGKSVTDLALHHADGAIYVPNWKPGLLRAIDIQTFELRRSYGFKPFGGTGYGEDDVYRVTPAGPGRLVIEEEDQWIDIDLFDTQTGATLATTSEREGGGVSTQNGRYYYHGDNNSSGAEIHRYDLAQGTFEELTHIRVESAGYYGSRTVVASDDGSRVFWNGSVFDAALNELWTIGKLVHATSSDGRLAFGTNDIFDTVRREIVLGMPVSTEVSAFNGQTHKLIAQVGDHLQCFALANPYQMPAPELTEATVTASSATIHWVESSLETHFTVQYRLFNSETWIDTTMQPGANETEATIGSLLSGETYEFRIKAGSPIAHSEWSNILTATTAEKAPSAPHLSAQLNDGVVVLSWTASVGARHYLLERKEAAHVEWSFLAEVDALEHRYIDSATRPHSTYHYRVRARAVEALSGPSNVITVTISAPPLAPDSLEVLLREDGSAILAWDKSSNASSYIIQRRLRGTNLWEVVAIVSSERSLYHDLTGSDRYDYRVAASNSNGTSEFNEWVVAPPKPTPPATPKPPRRPRNREDRRDPVLRLIGSRVRSTQNDHMIFGGTARDNKKLKCVEYSIAGQPGKKRAHGSDRWYVLVDLKPGGNVITVRAKDTSRNRSRPLRVVIFREKP